MQKVKCEHGLEVKVVIERIDPDYWDDGIRLYANNGGPAGDFVKIKGCCLCSFIELAEPEDDDNSG